MYPNVINNAYFKPSYRVPYYFVTNLNTRANVDSMSSNIKLEKIFDPCGEIIDVELSSALKLEIRCGSNEKYVPISVYIDYIKVPNKIDLTYDDLEREIDTTKMLEFPEYVCYEIVNECVKLILENSSDPRLQTNIPINQTIGTNVSQNK